MGKTFSKIRNAGSKPGAGNRAGRLFAAGFVLICLLSFLVVPVAQASGTDQTPGQAILTVQQTFTDDGSTAPSDTFSYQLTPKDTSDPMPTGGGANGYSFTVSGTDQTNIGLNFSTVGTYTYELSCVTTAAAGYTIDSTVYTIDVYVTNTLVTTTIVYLSDGSKAPAISFAQSYKNTMTELSGTKTWVYGNAPASDRPDNITVFIKNGNTVVKTITVTAAEGWKWSVALPRDDTSGNQINYTIDEANVAHYTHMVNGYNLVNTYLSPNYPGDNPKTGDNSNPALWISLMAGSAALFLLVVCVGRRSKKKSMSDQK